MRTYSCCMLLLALMEITPSKDVQALIGNLASKESQVIKTISYPPLLLTERRPNVKGNNGGNYGGFIPNSPPSAFNSKIIGNRPDYHFNSLKPYQTGSNRYGDLESCRYNNILWHNMRINPFQIDTKQASKQLHFAPRRLSTESKLQYTSNYLPYPPSFITFTTTETPPTAFPIDQTNVKKIRRKPKTDLWFKRQSKSLLDSYIPSWKAIAILQRDQQQSPLNSRKITDLYTLVFFYPLNSGKFKTQNY